MKMRRWISLLGVLLLGTAASVASASQTNIAEGVSSRPDVSITLKTGIGEEGMYFQGVGGKIDGQINPEIKIPEGAVVQLTLINGDGALHDVAIPEFSAKSDQVVGRDSSSVFVFRASEAGQFAYFCSIPGHRAAGMEGKLIVGEGDTAEQAGSLADISRDPTDLPAPIGEREPKTISVDMQTVEKQARLADGTSYRYWTFDGQVPGPLLRVREGDTVDLTLSNAEDSTMIHSVDFHAVTGPGGGASVLQVPPGGQKSLSFKAIKPGLYVYHCATPMVAHHIANGMYGMILVEPEGGLPPVDHEFYVMQGEIYTTQAYGQHGEQSFDVRKLLDEKPEYYVFNGAVGALTERHPLKAKVGESVRIFFGVGGPNATSSFHVIGEMFDKAYAWGGTTSAPAEHIQTISVPPGGATIVDFELEVPGKYVLVDHALSRMERGLAGFLQVEGEDVPEIYAPGEG
ncbi:copper-containing nitrite reductase [Salinisphaera sp.]|uniref:copper-containing nitrite reductase n=1 Tax=Salinisphaera sp. TaxID=1914330 RepID=UPI0025D2A5A4|nr:copper-containing nitrite reductase [Salinisphaera sp.]